MSKPLSLAELFKEASEDKKRRQLLEKERKEREVVPLLSELFDAVVKAKSALVEEPQEVFPTKEIVVEKEVIEPVQATPEKTPEKVEERKSEEIPSEKKLLKLFNRLQSDFQTLKKYVETKSSSYSGTSGSGEVRILRMDDVVKEAPKDGSVMTWNSILNKFNFKIPEEQLTLSRRTDFITDSLLYKGEAATGTSETAPLWRIRKMTIALDGDVVEIWANGTADYVHKWSDRLTLTYS